MIYTIFVWFLVTIMGWSIAYMCNHTELSSNQLSRGVQHLITIIHDSALYLILYSLINCIIQDKNCTIIFSFISIYSLILSDINFYRYYFTLAGISLMVISIDVWTLVAMIKMSIEELVEAFDAAKKVKGKPTVKSLIEEFYYPRLGPGQMYETMAEKSKKLGARLELNHRNYQHGQLLAELGYY